MKTMKKHRGITMDLKEAIVSRHSVRSYTESEIEEDKLTELYAEIYACNTEGHLNIQFITNDGEAFSTFISHYGKFSGVTDYIALIGPKSGDLDERIGYYGERIALKAQQIGLNTCWVALNFSKGKTKCKIEKKEKLICVLSIGYGKTQGVPHRNKPMKVLYRSKVEPPEWFMEGMNAAILAPTAMNQQKFVISYIDGNKVHAKANVGPYSKVDLGIVKYHFEVGSGKDDLEWV